MTATVTFSTLMRHPLEVVRKLDDGDVLITRRDGDDLRLSKARDAEGESQALQALAQLIAASLDEETCDHIAGRLTDPYPWIGLLPAELQHDFVGEYLRLARACTAVGRFDRLTIALAAWQATAEAYADPALTPDGTDLEYLDAETPAADPRHSA